MEIDRVHIDRLTVVGDPVHNFKLLIETSVFVDSMNMSKGRYKYNWVMHDGSYLEYQDDNPRLAKLRYDFNPNTATEKGALSILKMFKNPRLTRLDVAIDVLGEDLLNDWKVYDKQRRKQNIHIGVDGRLETIYLGSSGSDKQIRIYDKAREQKDDSKGKWWRVEAQLRAEKATLDENPFDDFLLYQYIGVDDSDLDYKDKALLWYFYNFPEKLKTEVKDWKTRKRIEGIVQENTKKNELTFAQVFVQHKENLISELNSWLSFCQLV